MATHVPPKKNDANGYVTYTCLVSQADGNIFQVNPTLAAGDVKIAIDDGAPANLATLPVVDADFTKSVKIVLSQAETNGDIIRIIFSDAAGSEWADQEIKLHTTSETFDHLKQVLTGKWEILNNQLIMYDTDGTTALYTFDLTRDGIATEFNPDKREAA